MIDPLDPGTLQAAREAAGFSRAELADRAGVNETTILRIEKGEVDPRVSGTWRSLVRALPDTALPFPSPPQGTDLPAPRTETASIGKSRTSESSAPSSSIFGTRSTRTDDAAHPEAEAA